ncbi:MAG: DMT family transporter [Chloroflexi bacterium]|nr:DMT family transporter [Chloroflexota bacterium]
MREWIIFWTLGVIWGSSFLLIKVGVEDLGPLPLVTIRLGLAALAMQVFLRLTGRHWPRQRTATIALIFIGVMNTAVPFTLITWGEQDIDSGLATVLNATVPLFTLVIAHMALADERITPQKAAGLLVGFVGVALLASRDTESSSPNTISGQLAVLGAALCYATSAVVIRRYLRQVDPFVIAGHSLAVGWVAITTVTLVVVHPFPSPADLGPDAVAAVITLALLNTMVAYFLFYHLMDQWGATRTTLVTYVMPPVGLTLGAVFLDEAVDWQIVVGAALILGGIVTANLRAGLRSHSREQQPDSTLIESDMGAPEPAPQAASRCAD